MLLVAIDFAEFTLTHVDEVIDELLTTDYSCDIAMPRIKKRYCFIVFFFSLLECLLLKICFCLLSL
jgi:hypothetical protein